MEQVEIEYIPEKPELYGDLDDEFRRVFEKFTFTESTASEVKRDSISLFTVILMTFHLSLISFLIFNNKFNTFRILKRARRLLPMQW